MQLKLRNIFIALTAVMAVCAFATSSAFASTKQITIVEENNGLDANPMATLEKLKAMGVTEVKYAINWQYLLPASQANAAKAPAGATSPTFYFSDFGQLAQIDRDASQVGIKLGFLVTSPLPKWAQTSTGGGCSAYGVQHVLCNPSVADFGVLMTALGTYFSGSVSGVPAVTWWSIWNEPNYGTNISPELTKPGVYAGADQYRNLLDAAWTALKATGHSTPSNTILFGDLAPRGIAGSSAGTNVGVKPVTFLAALYCVNGSGQRLTGKLASENGCPSSAAAFRAENPALFDASGIADHPYSQGIAPTIKTADCTIGGKPTACVSGGGRSADPLWTDLAGINNLTSALSRDLRANGSSTQFPIWNTEYGYWTTTSSARQYYCTRSYQADCDASPANAATYSNEAEYISYHNPRIVSFDQYQLFMPRAGSSAWSDGLLTASGQPEATYGPWEVPLWIPTTTLGRAGNITVWGGAKPATFDQSAYGAAPQVQIQFKGRSGGWTTLKTQTVLTGTENPGSYFQTTVKVTASGSIRLVYSGGKAGTLDSRTQAVTVR